MGVDTNLYKLTALKMYIETEGLDNSTVMHLNKTLIFSFLLLLGSCDTSSEYTYSVEKTITLSCAFEVLDNLHTMRNFDSVKMNGTSVEFFNKSAGGKLSFIPEGSASKRYMLTLATTKPLGPDLDEIALKLSSEINERCME